MSAISENTSSNLLGGVLILFVNLLLGIGAYAVAWQFNDGKEPTIMLGASILVMVLPNMIIGFVCKISGYSIANYFKYMAIAAFVVGMMVLVLG